MDDVRWTPSGWWRSLEREQKTSVLILGVCGLVTILLAVVQLRGNVIDPFRVSKQLLERSKTILAKQDEEEKNQELLKTKDTDFDGLSDYDELNVYHTSPYLADSDSDGMRDPIELAQGSDPNCPKGKSCFAAADTLPVAVTSTFEDFAPVGVGTIPPELLGIDTSKAKGVQSFIDAPPAPETMNAAQIREYLTAHQLVTVDELSKLSDKEITDIYKMAYLEVTQINQAYKSPTSTTIERAPADLFGDE